MSETPAAEPATTGHKRDGPDRAHLTGIAAGCGCVEVWAHLGGNRED